MTNKVLEHLINTNNVELLNELIKENYVIYFEPNQPDIMIIDTQRICISFDELSRLDTIFKSAKLCIDTICTDVMTEMIFLKIKIDENAPD